MSLVVWTRQGAIRLAAVSLRPIGEFVSGLRQVSVEFCHVLYIERWLFARARGVGPGARLRVWGEGKDEAEAEDRIHQRGRRQRTRQGLSAARTGTPPPGRETRSTEDATIARARAGPGSFTHLPHSLKNSLVGAGGH